MNKFILKNRIAILIIAALIVVGAISAALVVNTTILSNAGQSGQTAEIVNDRGVFPADAQYYQADEGQIVIGVAGLDREQTSPMSTALNLTDNPEDIWSNAGIYAGSHTSITAAQMKDGSIGVLTVPSLRLSVNIYESEDAMEAMSKGIAHFPSTSAFDGNVGMSAHNINMDGSAGYFRDLHTLKQGDIVQLKTGLGERSYAVSSISTIAASDWSPLSYTDDNRLTLITCISGQPDKRLCVQAVEQS